MKTHFFVMHPSSVGQPVTVARCAKNCRWLKGKCSRLLSLVSRRIAADWLLRYGYSPVLLETFVEQERFTGSCYRAANWIEVGTTKGCGKLEKNHQTILPLKSILIYPLQKNFRAILTG